MRLKIYSEINVKHRYTGWIKKKNKRIIKSRCPRSVVANALGCYIVVNEFKQQMPYYIHFPINTLEKVMNHFFQSYDLNSTSIVLTQG